MKSTIRKFLPNVFGFMLMLCLSAQSITAREAGSDSLSVKLDEIRVEATYSNITIGQAPLSVSYLNRSSDDMTSRPAATLNELTFSLPGIWINNRENHALGERMSIRGMGWRSPFGVRGIMVVLDDIPLTVADGQTIMNIVDPAMVQSLEILRGPSATFWGNASGGVLYLQTRLPADSPVLSIRSYGGSFNTMKHEVRWHDIVQGVRWNAYGSYFKSDGFRDHSATQLIRAGLSAGFDLSQNSSLEARFAYSGMPNAEHPGSLPQEEAGDNPTMAWPAFVNAGAGKDFQQLMTSVKYIHSFRAGILNISANSTYRDFNNPLLPSVGFIIVDRLAGGTRATFDVENLPFRLQFGAEAKWQRDEREQRNNLNGRPGNELSIDQTDFVNNQALFAKSGFELGDLNLSLGLRADRMEFSVDDFIANEKSSRSFTSLNPSIGLNYSWNQSWIYANFSTSFEAPTTTEFKNRPGGNTGFNPNLMPEKTIGFETGIRGLLQNLLLEYDIAFFNLNVQDLIIPFEEEDGGPTLFRNEGKTHHYGIESHVRFQPSNRFSLDFMYTWLNASFSDGDFEENDVPGLAPHRIGSTATIRIRNHSISSDVEWIGRYFADSENTAVNDSYLLMNGRYTFRGLTFENWRIQPFISVENIFNERYNTSVSINAFGGRYYEPGSDRKFTAGFRLDFI